MPNNSDESMLGTVQDLKDLWDDVVQDIEDGGIDTRMGDAIERLDDVILDDRVMAFLVCAGLAGAATSILYYTDTIEVATAGALDLARQTVQSTGDVIKTGVETYGEVAKAGIEAAADVVEAGAEVVDPGDLTPII